ncbi:MAG: hypothetical protein RJB38_2287 [Pseudomonadota bacterium]|jgi:dolichyl-phosphate-mannose--protein O-mannosyl transferase
MSLSPSSSSLHGIQSALGQMPCASTRRKTGTTIFFGFLALFLVMVQFPEKLNFDEFHYIPAARQILQWKESANYEHPPLGKELIALGMAIFGDRPIGWRFMSAVFGSLTLVGTYVAALALFRTQLLGVFVALLTGFNQMVYVQSRIAMLDTFMMGFLIWSFAWGLCAWFPLDLPSKRLSETVEARPLSRPQWHLYLSGIALGFAAASKWFAIVAWLGLMVLIGAWVLLRAWKARFDQPPQETTLVGFYPLPSHAFTTRDLLIAWGLLPLLAYYSSFIPMASRLLTDGQAVSWFDFIFVRQWKMWDGQLRVTASHPYSSSWSQWIFMLRPIWYAFDLSTDKSSVRGVLLLGNPVLIWGGLGALAWCARDWIRTRSFAAFWILATYGTFTFSWLLIPRKVTFFYYYYPSSILLSFAWGYLIHRSAEGTRGTPSFTPSPEQRLPMGNATVVLAVALGFFIYFFPILSAMKIPASAYRQWMWLQSWI